MVHTLTLVGTIVVYLVLCVSCVSVVESFPDLPLCGSPMRSYKKAKLDYPELVPALNTLSEQPIATWWTDNPLPFRNDSELVAGNPPTYREDVELLLRTCNSSTLPTIVVYGLPQKDCSAGYSDKGFIKNTAEYLAFIRELVTLVGDRPVLYVMEPDAIGLAAEGGCGATNRYLDNMQQAVAILTSNVNARVYLDVGFWMLEDSQHVQKIVQAIQQVGSASRPGAIRGIVLNTSNYRPTKELAKLCANFIQASNTQNTYRCVVDTSRNYRTPSTTKEWCNNKHAGVGHPPTSHTEYPDLLDYYLWIKVPGESDGECDGTGHSRDAMAGPRAAAFFEKAFSMQWDRGYFVDKKLGKPFGKYDTGLQFAVNETTKKPVEVVAETKLPTTTQPKEPQETKRPQETQEPREHNETDMPEEQKVTEKPQERQEPQELQDKRTVQPLEASTQNASAKEENKFDGLAFGGVAALLTIMGAVGFLLKRRRDRIRQNAIDSLMSPCDFKPVN